MTKAPKVQTPAKKPDATQVADCPVHTRSHESHDNLIRDLVKEKLEQAARADQMASMVKAANARATKAIGELSALRTSIKETTQDRTVKILANTVLEYEIEMKKRGWSP